MLRCCRLGSLYIAAQLLLAVHCHHLPLTGEAWQPCFGAAGGAAETPSWAPTSQRGLACRPVHGLSLLSCG